MKNTSKIALLAFLLAIADRSGLAQGSETPQGTAIPGIGSLGIKLDGPGYIEFGYTHDYLTANNDSWNDGYIRVVGTGGSNSILGELYRQNRFGDGGWYFSGGWTHTFRQKWYTDLHAGSSAGGFFLPRFRADAFINRKFLSREQLVLTGGIGYDKSKIVNSAQRFSAGGVYYFGAPWIVQGGVTWTLSHPDGTYTRTQYLAITEGHEKEHYITVRGEYGREAYELVGPSVSLFNFPIRNVTVNWRQWVGAKWGFVLGADRFVSRPYNRWGGTLGLFLDF